MMLEDGDIILVKVNHFSKWYRKLFAMLVRFFDGVYYHHSQIHYQGFLWEANTEVVAQLPDYNRGDEVLILRLKKPLTEAEAIRFNELLEKLSGRRYDYWGAMFHQLIYILSFRRIWIGKRGKDADRKPYCTELVTSIMYEIRGYFPEHYKTGPSKLLERAPLYYDLVFEGFF